MSSDLHRCWWQITRQCADDKTTIRCWRLSTISLKKHVYLCWTIKLLDEDDSLYAANASLPMIAALGLVYRLNSPLFGGFFRLFFLWSKLKMWICHYVSVIHVTSMRDTKQEVLRTEMILSLSISIQLTQRVISYAEAESVHRWCRGSLPTVIPSPLSALRV